MGILLREIDKKSRDPVQGDEWLFLAKLDAHLVWEGPQCKAQGLGLQGSEVGPENLAPQHWQLNFTLPAKP